MRHSEFMELFERADLVSDNKVNNVKLSSMKIGYLIDICKQSAEITSDDLVKPTDTIFSHSASLSLGGSRSPCASIECRTKNIQHLMQFSALYSDRVYIDNLFSYHIPSFKYNKASDLKRNIHEDLQLMIKIRPMLEAGIIVPITSKNTCGYCLANNKCGAEQPDCFSDIEKHLYDLFDSSTTVEITKENKNDYGVRCIGPERLIAHGSSNTNYKRSELIEIFGGNSFINKLKYNRPVILSDELKSKINVHRNLADDHLATIRFETASSKNLKTSYLSEENLHIDIINKYFSNSDFHRINNIIQKNMTTLLPFIDGVNSSEIMKLRQNDGDSFILFRKELNDIIKKYIIKSPEDFTDRSAMEIYSEFIEPELSKLNRTVKNAENSLSKGIVRKIASLTGALSFGFFTGYLPNLPAVISPLFNQIVNLQEWMMSQSDTEETIKSENMYFLWKVKQTIK